MKRNSVKFKPEEPKGRFNIIIITWSKTEIKSSVRFYIDQKGFKATFYSLRKSFSRKSKRKNDIPDDENQESGCKFIKTRFFIKP